MSLVGRTVAGRVLFQASMSLVNIHEGRNGVDGESLRSFSSCVPDDYHDWVSESSRTSR